MIIILSLYLHLNYITPLLHQLAHRILAFILAILLIGGCPDPFDRFVELDELTHETVDVQKVSGTIAAHSVFLKHRADDGNSNPHYHIMFIEVDSYCPQETQVFAVNSLFSCCEMLSDFQSRILQRSFEVVAPPPNQFGNVLIG